MKRKSPGPTARARAKKRRKKLAAEQAIKIQVRLRDGAVCRCCGTRRAESVHEIVPKSLGGKVSLENSIYFCGNGTQGCHGLAQRHEIEISRGLAQNDLNANGSLIGTVTSKAAMRWLKDSYVIGQIGHSFCIPAPPLNQFPA